MGEGQGEGNLVPEYNKGISACQIKILLGDAKGIAYMEQSSLTLTTKSV